MQLEEAPPFRMPAAGTAGTALLDQVPQGDVIDGLFLKMTGTFDATNIERVRVRLGGRDIVYATGEQLDIVNKYLGYPADADYLPLWFADPNGLTRQAYSQGALDTRNRTYSNMQVSVKMDGNQSGEGLDMRIGIGQNKVAPEEEREQIRSMFRALLWTQQDMEAGKQDYKLNIGTETGALIRGAYFFGSNITDAEWKRDGSDIIEEIPVADMEYIQKINRYPQSGMVALDPLLTNIASRAVPTQRPNGTPAPFRHILTMSSSETVDALTDVHTNIDRV